MGLLTEIRLSLCVIILVIVVKIAPKNNDEGLTIVKAIYDWTRESIERRREHGIRNS